MTRKLDQITEVVAAPVKNGLQLNAAGCAAEWLSASPVTFCLDWQANNPDPARRTLVRVLWSLDALYLRFECHYREIYVFSDADDPDGRRDHLWDRDVAEAFLQPDRSKLRCYKEFEVAPNGLWIDFDVAKGAFQDLKSGVERSAYVDDENRIWTAELKIPMTSLTLRFDPSSVWHANFYRVEGSTEPRSYFAWQPTNTPVPDFHVPEAFGKLRFGGIKTI
jgi:alpha-galactosidase